MIVLCISCFGHLWTKSVDGGLSHHNRSLSLLTVFLFFPFPFSIMSAPPYSLGPKAQRRYHTPNSNASSTTSLLPPTGPQHDMPRRQPNSPNPPLAQLPGANFHPMSASPKSVTPSLRSSASNLSLVSLVNHPLPSSWPMTFTPQLIFFY